MLALPDGPAQVLDDLYLTLRPEPRASRSRLTPSSCEFQARPVGRAEGPRTLLLAYSVARFTVDQGDFEGAQGLRERALETRRNVLGDEQLDTLKSAPISA
jgi:hypothetical protein